MVRNLLFHAAATNSIFGLNIENAPTQVLVFIGLKLSGRILTLPLLSSYYLLFRYPGEIQAENYLALCMRSEKPFHMHRDCSPPEKVFRSDRAYQDPGRNPKYCGFHGVSYFSAEQLLRVMLPFRRYELGKTPSA